MPTLFIIYQNVAAVRAFHGRDGGAEPTHSKGRVLFAERDDASRAERKVEGEASSAGGIHFLGRIVTGLAG